MFVEETLKELFQKINILVENVLNFVGEIYGIHEVISDICYSLKFILKK